jgi:hypothetical protein
MSKAAELVDVIVETCRSVGVRDLNRTFSQHASGTLDERTQLE